MVFNIIYFIMTNVVPDSYQNLRHRLGIGLGTTGSWITNFLLFIPESVC
jgi:hypothetical protein